MRRTSLPVLALVALVALAGCGASRSSSVRSPAASAPTGAPTLSTPTPTSGPTQGPTASACPTTGAAAIPDGTWNGPLTMDISGRGASSGFGRSTGRGTLQLTVVNGAVTSGRWSVLWRSTGHADTPQATATITLRGTLSGTAHGTATGPVLPALWALRGRATITRPVRASVPVDETGRDAELLRITSTSCAVVTGTFLPSFTSKDARARFRGTARWVGGKI